MSDTPNIDAAPNAQRKQQQKRWEPWEDEKLASYIDQPLLERNVAGLLPHRSFHAIKRRVSKLRDAAGKQRSPGRAAFRETPAETRLREAETRFERSARAASAKLLAALQRADFYERPAAR